MTTTQRTTLLRLIDACAAAAHEFGARDIAADLTDTRERLRAQPDVSAGTTGQAWRETLHAGRAR